MQRLRAISNSFYHSVGGEINGTHNRTDFDLTRHQNTEGPKCTIADKSTNEKFIPYIIESTSWSARTVLARICGTHDEEDFGRRKNDTRVVFTLPFKPAVAAYHKAAVLPLSKLVKVRSKINDVLPQSMERQLASRVNVCGIGD